MIKPYIKEIKTNLKPMDIFCIFENNSKYNNCVFLDSGMNNESLGEYSFIGINPFMSIKYKNNICKIDGKVFSGNIFEELNKIINRYRCVNETKIPFIGGGIGYFAYDLVHDMEKLPNIAYEQVDIPTCYYNFYDNIIIYSHIDNKVCVSALGIKESKENSIKEIENIITSNGSKKQEIF